MTDRRVDLNLNTPTFQQDEHAAGLGKRERGPASEGDRERFERSLERNGETQTVGGKPSAPVVDSPFALFGASVPEASASPQQPASGLKDVNTLLDRLMVGEGGQGGKMVRMALSDDLLPGVSVSVSESGGGWLVECECSNDDSRERLCAQVRELASEMADRVGRETLWRITTDDPEDLRPVEARAQPEAAT